MKRKVHNDKLAARLARKGRVFRRLRNADRPRLVVYRSARHIYAQLVEPEGGRTLASASTRSKTLSAGLSATGNVEAAKRVGKAIAEAARAQQIEDVVFHRNGFLYHGRVRALAEAAREAGLKF